MLTQSHFTLLAPSKFLPSMLQNKCDHTDTLNRTRQFSQEQSSQCYCAHYLGLSMRPQSSTFLLFFLAGLLLYPSLLSSCTTNYTSFYLSTLSSSSLCSKQDFNGLPRANITKHVAVSLIKGLPLTEAHMWFFVHLDDIVKVHQ